MWEFAGRVRMPSGAGAGWVLVHDTGIELCIRYEWNGLLSYREAVDFANLHVRVLDDRAPAEKTLAMLTGEEKL